MNPAQNFKTIMVFGAQCFNNAYARKFCFLIFFPEILRPYIDHLVVRIFRIWTCSSSWALTNSILSWSKKMIDPAIKWVGAYTVTGSITLLYHSVIINISLIMLATICAHSVQMDSKEYVGRLNLVWWFLTE